MTQLPLHVDVHGITPKLERESTDGHHKVKVDALVLVHANSPNKVVPWASSTMDEGKVKRYYDNATRKWHSSLSAQELITILKRDVAPEMRRRSDNPYLVLDNNSAHTAKLTRKFCVRAGIKLVFLPPHSPDLSPLDCNLFGVARNKFNIMFPGATQPWATRAKSFVSILRDSNAEPHVKGWPAKLQQVVRARGRKLH